MTIIWNEARLVRETSPKAGETYISGVTGSDQGQTGPDNVKQLKEYRENDELTMAAEP
jgi:hypothetical protein